MSNYKYYIVKAVYEDFDSEFDRRLEKAVGRSSDASGFGLGERDLAWYFKTEKAAKKALGKLNRFRKYNCGAEMIPGEEYW